jgi:hypothetical protein
VTRTRLIHSNQAPNGWHAKQKIRSVMRNVLVDIGGMHTRAYSGNEGVDSYVKRC